MIAWLWFGVVWASMTPPDYRVELGERLAAEVTDLAQQGHPDQAIDRARAITSQVEALAPVLYELALVYNRDGDIGAAMKTYDRTIAVDPDHAAAHYDRGELRLVQGDRDGARQDFAAAARLMPDHWAVHFRLAHIAALDHDPRAFEQHLIAALREGFDFRVIADDPEWRAWSRDPDLGPVLARLITVYSDEAVLQQLQAQDPQ